VPVDLAARDTRLARTDDNLTTALEIVTIDIEVADVTAYDAARIAVTAHRPSRPRSRSPPRSSNHRRRTLNS
jgi:hypothetical protein